MILGFCKASSIVPQYNQIKNQRSIVSLKAIWMG